MGTKLEEMKAENLRKTEEAKAARKAEQDARLAEYLEAVAEAEADPDRRKAVCYSCRKSVPSHRFLSFLETAEHFAQGRCSDCGYADVAHEEPTRSRPHLAHVMGDGHVFTQAEPRDHDTFYCGCRGWD